MNDQDKMGCMLVAAFVCALFALVVGHSIGNAYGLKTMKCEAVKVGAAEWRGDETGVAVFAWKKAGP